MTHLSDMMDEMLRDMQDIRHKISSNTELIKSTLNLKDEKIQELVTELSVRDDYIQYVKDCITLSLMPMDFDAWLDSELNKED